MLCIPKDERQKLDSKARKCIFLGYPCNRKGYRLYDQSIRRVIHSQHVTFNESIRGVEKESIKDPATTNPRTVVDTITDESKALVDNPSGEMVEKDGTNDERSTEKGNTEPEGEIIEPTVRRSQRETRRPNFYGELVNSAKIISKLTTVEEASSCPEKKEVMEDKFQPLQANQEMIAVNLTEELHTEQFTKLREMVRHEEYDPK